MKKILITNDDGINSNGIARLARVAAEFGRVWVVAPDSERSAMSHSVTLRHSFDAWKSEFAVPGVEAYACDGTPADCVRIGVLNIVPGGPDHVFSGINYGYNAATDIQYSATAGAAFEAAFQGVHAIAFSEEAWEDHSVTDRYIRDIMSRLISQPLSTGEIWNVNFPGCGVDNCKGILWDRSVSTDVYYADTYKETRISEDRISYMVVGTRNYNAEKGTDLEAILNNYISVGIARNIS